jgi:hypothetical protein
MLQNHLNNPRSIYSGQAFAEKIRENFLKHRKWAVSGKIQIRNGEKFAGGHRASVLMRRSHRCTSAPCNF